MKRIFNRKTLIVLLVIFALMQFYRIDKTNPPLTPDSDFILTANPPAKISKMIKAACYDCHSNETVYPWYTSIMPFSKYVKGHIEHGREHLNYSTFGSYPADEKKHLLKESAEKITATEMPLLSYIILHSEARISETQRKELADWFLKEAAK